MRAAQLSRSSRLQRALAVLADGAEHSTPDLVQRARICAVNSVIGELRCNGIEIHCRQTSNEHGDRIWLYRIASHQTRRAA